MILKKVDKRCYFALCSVGFFTWPEPLVSTPTDKGRSFEHQCQYTSLLTVFQMVIGT
jgi:hypothetical protein